MQSAASAMLRKAGAVTAYLDQAMHSAVTAAMAAAYSALGGIGLLDFVTAGDSRVCVRCQECADDGPYTPQDYPGSQHPRCRCIPQPSGGLTPPARHLRRLHDQAGRVEPVPATHPQGAPS